jgi:effector-binding domain-containing protein
MKALKIIGIILLALVALFLIVAAFLPAKLHIEESLVINKPASLIFKQVNNFQNYPAWSPWLELDPEMTNTYEGPKQGVGAKSIWTSKINGDGNMTIIESLPYKKVTSSLDFGQRGTANSDFLFEDEAGGTKVTWTLDIPSLSYPVERYFSIMMPGMMKPVFIQGLEKLKKVTEAMPDPPALQLIQLPDKPVVSMIDSCNWADIEMKMGQMFGEIMTLQKSAKFEFAGSPMSLYHKWDETNQFAVFENCVPVDREVVGKGRIQYKILPATRAVMGIHFGAYDQTMYMYSAMDEFIQEFGLEENGGPIEEFITDPMNEPDTAKWQTNIYFPVK